LVHAEGLYVFYCWLWCLGWITSSFGVEIASSSCVVLANLTGAEQAGLPTIFLVGLPTIFLVGLPTVFLVGNDGKNCIALIIRHKNLPAVYTSCP